MSLFPYAICNETFQNWPHKKAFEYASQLGYTGIEIAPFTLNSDARLITPEQRNEICELAQRFDLEVIGLHWLLAFTEGFYLTSPDAEVREKTSAYLADLAQLCHDVGGKVMVLGSPKQRNLLPGMSHDQAMDFAADVIKGACDTFADLNVTLAVEPLGPEEGDFLLTAESGLDLVSRVGSEQVKLHLDCKAMSSENKAIESIIRESLQKTAHFHANDPNRRGPGMGELDFVPIMQTLKDCGYQGWVSVEVFDYEPGVERLATESLNYLRQVETQLSV
jgi:sugar phosphate isomerase/epimerase